MRVLIYLLLSTCIIAGSSSPVYSAGIQNGTFDVDPKSGRADPWKKILKVPIKKGSGTNVPHIDMGAAFIGDVNTAPGNGYEESGINQKFDCDVQPLPADPYCVVTFDYTLIQRDGELAKVTLKKPTGASTFTLPVGLAQNGYSIYLKDCVKDTEITFWIDNSTVNSFKPGYDSGLALDNVSCKCENGKPVGPKVIIPDARTQDPFQSGARVRKPLDGTVSINFIPVPTMSKWAIIALGSLVLLSSVFLIRKLY